MSISKETIFTAVGVVALLGLGAWIGCKVAEKVNEVIKEPEAKDETPEAAPVVNYADIFAVVWGTVSFEEALCADTEDGMSPDLYGALLDVVLDYIHNADLSDRHNRKHFPFLDSVENVEVRTRLKEIAGKAINVIYRDNSDVDSLKAVTLGDIKNALAS